MPNAQRIIPLLVYKDIEAGHDFLVSAFGLQAGPIDRDDEGHVVHGEVYIESDVIWLHRVTSEHGLIAAGSQDAASGLVATSRTSMHTNERACAAGASIDKSPVDQPYGRREYEARDPEGHRWWFGTPLS